MQPKSTPPVTAKVTGASRVRRVFGHPIAPLLAGAMGLVATGEWWIAAAMGFSVAVAGTRKRRPTATNVALDTDSLDHDVAVASRNEADAQWVLQRHGQDLERALRRQGPAAAQTLAAHTARAWVLLRLGHADQAAEDARALVGHYGAIPRGLRPHVLGVLAMVDGPGDTPILDAAWPMMSAADRAYIADGRAGSESEQGRRAEAHAWLRRGIEALQLGPEPPTDPYRGTSETVAAWRDPLMLLLSRTVKLHDADGDFEAGHRATAQLWGLAEAAVPLTAADRALAARLLARTEQNAGHYAAATRRLQAIVDQPVGSDPLMADAWVGAHASLAALALDTDRPTQAAKWAREGLAAAQAHDVHRHDDELRGCLARSLVRSGDVAGARVVVDDAEDDAVVDDEFRAELHAAQGDYAAAQRAARQAVVDTTAQWGPGHPMVTEPLAVLGRVLVAADRPAEAAGVLQQAIAIVEARCGRQHPQLVRLLEPLGDVTEDPVVAARLRDRAAELRQEHALPTASTLQ